VTAPARRPFSNPLSFWPHHTVSHVMEMTGPPENGLGWTAAREALWATSPASEPGPYLAAQGAVPCRTRAVRPDLPPQLWQRSPHRSQRAITQPYRA
jgi:hypothetical protein